MEEFLRELTPVQPGDQVTKVASSRRINAMQALLVALAGKASERAGSDGGRVKERLQRRPRFNVWFHADSQRLYVTEGMVAVAMAGSPDSVIRPMEPTLDGTPLRENPYWSIADKEVGADYEVICIFDPEKARMVLHKKDDELELEDDERPWLIATVTFKTVGAKKGIEELDQRWSCDIPWLSDGTLSSSPSTSDGDGDSESDDDGFSDSDSEGGSDETSDDDSGDGSSSSSCCPAVTLYPTLVDTGDPSGCMPVTGPGMTSMVTFYVQGIVNEYDCECTNLWVEFGIGGKKDRKFLGQNGGGQEFAGWFEVFAVPCSKFTAWARVRAFGPSVSGDGCNVPDDCETFQVVDVPGACPDGECGDDSGDGSDDSSDSSGGSSSSTPEVPCENDARLTNKVILTSNSGRFTIENHGTCSVFVNRIYCEGSIVAWNFTPDPNTSEVEVPAGHGQHFELAAAEGDPGSISGTVVEVGYHYEGQATELVPFVF
jgi:hypothetical protein